jgi:hypothetical protein
MLDHIYERTIKASWQSPRPPEVSIEFIVAHSTVGRDSRKYLKTGGGRQVSIHKLVQKLPRADSSASVDLSDIAGDAALRNQASAVIYTMVTDDCIANHAGFSRVTYKGVTYARNAQYSVNTVSLGFELENYSDPSKGFSEPYSDMQLLAMGYVINTWRAKYGHLPVMLHRDIDASLPTGKSGKHDPVGLTVGNIEYWCQMALAKSVDVWSLWGTAYALNKTFGIPQAWYKVAAKVGAAISDEVWRGDTSIQFFERGIGVYNKVVNKATVIAYADF